MPAPKIRRRSPRKPLPVYTMTTASGLLKLPQIVPHLIPMGRSTWLKAVKAGIAPQPVRLKPGGTFWRAEDLRAFSERCGR